MSERERERETEFLSPSQACVFVLLLTHLAFSEVPLAVRLESLLRSGDWQNKPLTRSTKQGSTYTYKKTKQPGLTSLEKKLKRQYKKNNNVILLKSASK